LARFIVFYTLLHVHQRGAALVEYKRKCCKPDNGLCFATLFHVLKRVDGVIVFRTFKIGSKNTNVKAQGVFIKSGVQASACWQGFDGIVVP